MSRDRSLNINGLKIAAEILCRLPGETRERLVESIRDVNPGSALKIESIIVHELAPAPTRQEARSRQENAAESNTLPATIKSSDATADTTIPEVVDVEYEDLLPERIKQLEAAQARFPKNAEELYRARSSDQSSRRRRIRTHLA
jgi:hypothetical protein